MLNLIDSNKSLPHDSWVEFFERFSGDLHDQYISIKNISLDCGDKSLINYSPLMAITYVQDQVGDRLLIVVRQADLIYTHTIYSPTKVSIKKRSKGEIMAVWISDAAGTKTSIRLQASDRAFHTINHCVTDSIDSDQL